MKIFVVEDERASVESARMQLGKDHELTFFTTAMEVGNKLLDRRMIAEHKPDLILTDVNIPMGDTGAYSLRDHYSSGDMIPAGLVVALKALQLRVPCVIVTDSNSHRDVIGFLLNHSYLHSMEIVGIPQMVDTVTKVNRIDTPVGQGKDWLHSLRYQDDCSVQGMIGRLTTPKKSYEEMKAEGLL